MHFKTKVSTECYEELDLPKHNTNNGKYHTEIIGNTHVNYTLYSSGTVNVDTVCSKNPYKLETEQDRSRIIAFFGQIRDRLILLLNDKHEKLVPDIMDWQLTECDINKDIKVSDSLHIAGIKIQVKHVDHLFGIYVKSMEKDTVLRIEEAKYLSDKKSPVEYISDIFNPREWIENRLEAMEQRITQKLDAILNSNCYVCQYKESDGIQL
jgi:hypothetical protein